MLSWIGSAQRKQIYNQIGSLQLRPIYLCSIPCLIFFVVVYLSFDRDSALSTTWQNGNKSSWDYERYGKRLVMNISMCEKTFPDLYQHVDRMVKTRRNDKITKEMLDALEHHNGYVRVMLYDQQLYIIDAAGTFFTRQYAVIQAIHRAVVTSPELLPNIEFVISTDDKLPPAPLWAFARDEPDQTTWLMPDFGFWSWPEPKVGGYGEVQRKAKAMEDTPDNPTGRAWPWDTKKETLFWRGATMGLGLREKFLSVTADKPWADVAAITWKDKSAVKSMDEHCQYKYVAHTEGNSYSGRLKYLQNCRSVIVIHKMDWMQHYTHLMVASGSKQNYVEVKRDFSDLESTILWLRDNDEKAARIADNNVKMFRERYLTPAANVCYWRRLIRGWAEASFEPSPWEVKDGVKKWRGLEVESWLLERRMDWDPY